MGTCRGRDAADTNVEAVAERVLADVRHVDALRGVGYYSPEDCGTVYLREDVRRQVSDATAPLEDAVLESIGVQTIEEYFDDTMTATMRLFEGIVVLYSCVARHRGVVVVVDRDPGPDYAALLERLETMTVGD